MEWTPMLTTLSEHSYGALLRTPCGLVVPGLRVLILDGNALHFLTAVTTKERVAVDGIIATVLVSELPTFTLMPHFTAVALLEPNS